MYYNVIFSCRQLKDKYMYTENYNNQQNIPELLKAILQQNSNVFRGPPLFQEEQGTLCHFNLFVFKYILS